MTRSDTAPEPLLRELVSKARLNKANLLLDKANLLLADGPQRGGNRDLRAADPAVRRDH